MQTKPFKLGLTMAGAVSAGAYTSGVLTQIFEALACWYKLRSGELGSGGDTVTLLDRSGKNMVVLPLDKLPQHQIELVALSGTSAGGMCAALLPIALSENNLDRLRKTWVDDVDIRDMLDPADLDTYNKKLISLLNVKGIDAIKDAAKDFLSDPDMASGKSWPAYLKETIDIYLNLTNLEGIPYVLSLNNAKDTKSQIIRSYADYKRFTFIKPGTTKDKVPGDSTELNPASKVRKGTNYEWDALMETAVATGAFPIGLRPRTLLREKREYDKREFFLKSNLKADGSFPEPSPMVPSWPEGSPPSFLMEYVDGGMTNNEPFEQARRAVAREIGRFRNPSEGDKAISGVILVDPFPSDPINIPGDVIKEIPDMLHLLPLMIGVMKDNAQFDIDLLDSILNPDIYSRYMISPVRYDAQSKPEEFPLASGLLAAFSGFFSQKFRDHDYNLARYNTSHFLAKHFALPITNTEIFGDLYQDEERITLYRQLDWVFDKADSKGNTTPHMTLIPQIRFADTNLKSSYSDKAPAWPQLPKDELDGLKSLAYKRFKQVRKTAIDNMTGEGFMDSAKDSAIDLALSAFIGEKFFNKKWESLVEEKFRKAKLIK